MENINPIDMKQKNSCPYMNRTDLDDMDGTLKYYEICLPNKEPYNQEQKLENELFTDNTSRNLNLKEEYNDDSSYEFRFFVTKTDSSQSLNNIINTEEEKHKINVPNNIKRENKFKTFKEKKKEVKNSHMGRKRKDNSKSAVKDQKKYHGKFSKDNIIQRIKVGFLKAAIKYSNELYEKFKKKKCDKLIKMMRRKYGKYLNDESKKNFLSVKLSEIFSGKISLRCSKVKNEDYNKDNISKLLEKGEPKELVNFLNLTVEDAYEIFRREGEDKIPEFNFKNVLDNIKSGETNAQGEDYKEKFRTISKSFLEIIKNS